MDRRFNRGLATSMGLVVGMVVFNAALAFHNSRRVRATEAQVAHTYEVLSELEGVLSSLKDAETGQRGYLITAEPRYLEPYDAAVKNVPAELDHLVELVADDEAQQRRIAALRELIDTKFFELRRTIVLVRDDPDKAHGFLAAREVLLTDRGKNAMDAIRAHIAEMEIVERDLLKLRERESNDIFGMAILTNLLAAALGLGAVGAALFLLNRNLASHQRAAFILHAERERFRTTLTSIGDAVIVTDAYGRVTLLNAAAGALTGWNDDAIGRDVSEVFHIVNEHTRRPVDNPVERVLRDGRVVGLANHTILIARDGAETPIDDSGAPIRDADGVIDGAVLVFHNITERKKAEDRLREADRRKDEFLAMLAHELRNPLAPIGNAIQVLRTSGPSEEQLVWARDLIDRQVQHLTRLVDDLLDVSRITSGKIALRKEPVDVADVVAHAIETTQPMIEARRQKLELHVPADAGRIDGDPTRLAQVVANLLNNAAKYTDEGGQIRLAVEREGGMAVVRVRDTGIGIPPEMLPHVFDLFTQVDNTLERTQGGLGIGLTLVRRLVALHGGSVKAFSEGRGRGSEFVVRLPLLADEAKSKPAAPEVEPPATEKVSRRVLVVDDIADSAESLAKLLQLWGHEVRIALDGAAGLAAVQEFRPDLALLDIGMPGLNGYDLAARVRAMPGLEGVTLIALTGFGTDEDLRRSADAGFDAHFIKPVDLAALRRLLEKPREE